MNKVWLLIGLVLFLAGCAQVPPEDNGGTFIIEQGYELHWSQRSFPIPVLIDDRFHTDFQLLLLVGCELWNSEIGHAFDTSEQVFDCQTANLGGHQYLTEGDLAFVPSGSVVVSAIPLPPRFVAVTLPDFTPHGVVKRALVVFNQYQQSLDELIDAMVHELGHVLGLAHDPATDSVMYASTSETAWTIQALDLYHVYRQLQQPHTFR